MNENFELYSQCLEYVKDVDRLINLSCKKFKLKTSQYRVLQFLDEEKDLKMIVSHLNYAAPNVTYICDKLFEAGLINRDLSDMDRRSYYVSRTHKGDHVISKLKPLIDNLLKNKPKVTKKISNDLRRIRAELV